MGLVNCFFCSKEFYKDNRHINENKKLGHKSYCSSVCLVVARTKRIELKCNNPNCRKVLFRSPGAISPRNFCNHLCSATVNNKGIIRNKLGKNGQEDPEIKRIVREKISKNVRDAISKYSAEEKLKRRESSSRGGKNRWENYQSAYTKEYVLEGIKSFYLQMGRVPVKRELNRFYLPARKFFRTWNKAIEEVGLKPNPVLFADHHLAKDGHKCDSLAEMIIDDYLSENNIKHLRCVPYTEGPYTADFKIGHVLVEYYGLAGEFEKYDNNKQIKKNLAVKYNLKVLEVYPKDLYPNLRLDRFFRKKQSIYCIGVSIHIF